MESSFTYDPFDWKNAFSREKNDDEVKDVEPLPNQNSAFIFSTSQHKNVELQLTTLTQKFIIP